MTENKPDKKAVGILTAGHFVVDLYSGFITPIMPLIAAKLDINLGMVGMLFSISSMSASLLQPFFGFISDMLTRRFFIIWGIILASTFISLTGWVNNFWILGLILFLGNMGVGFYHPQATAMVGHFSRKEINNLMGFFIAAGTLGYATGPLVSSHLVKHFGVHSTIYIIFPGLIIAGLIYISLPKAPVVNESPRIKEVFKTIASLKAILIPLATISVLRALSVISFNIFMPFIWKQYNFSVLLTGSLIAMFSIVGGISSFIGGKLNNRFGEKPILLLSSLPAIPCLLGTLFLIDVHPIISFILFVTSGVILNLATSVNIVIAQKSAPDNMGMVSGLIGGFSWGLAGLMLTPIGFLGNVFGLQKVLAIIALTPILTATAVSFLPKITRKRA